MRPFTTKVKTDYRKKKKKQINTQTQPSQNELPSSNTWFLEMVQNPLPQTLVPYQPAMKELSGLGLALVETASEQ